MIYWVFNSNLLLIWGCNLAINKASLILRLPTLCTIASMGFFIFYPSNSWRCTCKKPRATIVFDFIKAFYSIHRGKMEQILLPYGLPKETIAAIMMLYRNTKVKVHSSHGDRDYFDIVVGILQEDTLAPYLFIICLDYMLRTSIDKMKDNSFNLTKERSRRYPTQTITNADYTDDIVFLANAPTQAEILLYSLEWAAAGIGLYVNAHIQNICALIKKVTSLH